MSSPPCPLISASASSSSQLLSTFSLSAAVAPLPAPMTASSILKASCAATARERPLPQASAQPRTPDAVAVSGSSMGTAQQSAGSFHSSLLAASSSSPQSSSVERLSRVRRLQLLCQSSASSSAGLSAGEVLVALAYLCRSLTSEESQQLQRILEPEHTSEPAAAVHPAAAPALSMRCFQLALQDVMQQEEDSTRGEGEAAHTGDADADAGDAESAFVARVLARLRCRVEEERAAQAVQERVGLDQAVVEVARARQALRSAEDARRVLSERVERLTLHCRRVEEDNARLLQLTASARSAQQSEAVTHDGLHSTVAQQQAALARLQASLQLSHVQLCTVQAEQQHSLALLQMERSAKKAAGQELLQLRAQVSALQAERSSEMRSVLKRKKEEMAAIMDSHRYTKELKRQAERVQPLELELQHAKSTISKQQDDIAEYQRLLDDWRGGGRGWEGGPGTALALPPTRPRAGLSLSEDLDLDDSAAGPSVGPSRGHSRQVSSVAQLQRSVRRSSGELVEQLAQLKLELLQHGQSATELRGHRDALLVSLSHAAQEKEELEGRLQAHQMQWQLQAKELRVQEELVLQAQSEGEEQRKALQAEETRRLRQLQEDWRLQREEWEERLRRQQLRMEEADATTARLNAALDSRTAEHRRAVDELSASRLREEAAEASRRALLTASADSAEAQLRQLRAELAAAQAEVAALSSERAGLTARLSAAEAQLQRYELLYPQAMRETERLTRLEADWQREREQLLQRIDDLQRAIDSHVCPTLQPPAASDSTAVAATETSASSPQSLHLLEGQAEVGEVAWPLTSEASMLSLVEPAAPPSASVWPCIPLSEEQQLEVSVYSRYVNLHLRHDGSLAHLLPLQEGSSELLAKVRDGLLLSALLNHAVPGLIDERALNRRSADAASLSWQQVVQNLNLVINAAKAVGIAMTLQHSHTQPTPPHAPAAAHRTHTAATSTPATSHRVDDDSDDVDLSSSSTLGSTLSPVAGRPSSASVVVRRGSRSGSSSSTDSPLSPPPPYMTGRNRRSSSGQSEDSALTSDDELSAAESTTAQAARKAAVSSTPSASLALTALSSSSCSSALDLGSTQLQLMESSQPWLLLDFIHRIIRLAVMKEVDARRRPRMRLLSTVAPACSEQALLGLTQEQLLARWLHFTNKQPLSEAPARSPLTLSDLDDELRSGCVYQRLLTHLFPHSQTENTAQDPATTSSQSSAAELAVLERVLAHLSDAGVSHFHTGAAVLRGPARLHPLLLACVFTHNDGLPALPVETAVAANATSIINSAAAASSVDDDSESGREERSFRSWINSAGVAGVAHVQSLFSGDCADGLLLLRLIDWVERGSVDWKAVELQPSNKFKAVSNCNLAIRLCKTQLRASLVGIGGEDIHDGRQKLILAVVWQLVRYNAIKKLELIRLHNGQHTTAGKQLTDSDILVWANAAVAAQPHPVAARTGCLSLRSWRDPSCTTAIFLLNLLHTLDGAVVDWQQVKVEEKQPQPTAAAAPPSGGRNSLIIIGGIRGRAATLPSAGQAGATSTDPTLGLCVASRVSNALYAISIARKLGAEAFLMPEDIVECKQKMLLLFVGSCMALQQEQQQQQQQSYT